MGYSQNTTSSARTASAALPLLHQVVCQHLLPLLCVAILLSATGCRRPVGAVPGMTPPLQPERVAMAGRFQTGVLVDQIDSHYRGTNPGPIGVTTLVNLDDLYASSTFGRLFSEQMMSELALRGYDIVELRHADALNFLASTGEFALSRDVASVRRERDLGGMVVGTYVASPFRVYVNARLLDPNTSVVLAAGSVEIDKTPEVARMLRGGLVTASLERVPVKRLGFSTFPLMGGGRGDPLEDEQPFPIPPKLADPPKVQPVKPAAKR